MKLIQKTLVALLASAPTLAAQSPLIVNIVNPAGGASAYFGMAQGSLMLISGYGLGPSALNAASPPLPAAAGLAGTTVTITVGDTKVSAPIYYTRTDSVEAVLPSKTPIGSGIVTVSYNGESDFYPITIVPAAFGVFSSAVTTDPTRLLTSAAITFPNYQYVSSTNPAKPGDTLTIWGSGLGATPNDGGDTGAAPAVNIGHAPLVFVGGIPAPSVTYWGRSPGAFPGVDQINFVVPLEAPLGCNVSVIVQTDSPPAASNGPVIALAAADGAPCTDPTQTIPAFVFNQTGMKTVFLDVGQTVNNTATSSGTAVPTYATAGAQIRFYKFPQANPGPITDDANLAPTLGACYSSNAFPGLDPGTPAGNLDAGTTITLTPPSGPALNLRLYYPGYYAAAASNLLPAGAWNLSNAAGGQDVGAIQFSFPVPQPVAWTNQVEVLSHAILRDTPLTITWSGGDPNSYVEISGFGGEFGFRCAAASAAGQFTIPPSILLGFAQPVTKMFFQISAIALPFGTAAVPGLDAVVNESVFVNTYAFLTFK